MNIKANQLTQEEIEQIKRRGPGGIVVPFVQREPVMQTGPAVCVGCGHEWDARAPVGEEMLDCPQCGTTKGIRKGLIVPPDNEPVMVCECGNSYFNVMQQGLVLCIKCGIVHDSFA